MTCAEALELFIEKDYKPMLQDSLGQAESYCNAHRDEFTKRWIDSLRAVGRLKVPFVPRYMVYTYLRTNLMERNYAYDICLYDRKWYFGEPALESGWFDAGESFGFWGSLWDALLVRSKRYVGKVSKADVRILVMTAAQAYNNLFARNLIGLMDEIRSCEDCLYLTEHGGIKLYFGELMGELFEVK